MFDLFELAKNATLHFTPKTSIHEAPDLIVLRMSDFNPTRLNALGPGLNIFRFWKKLILSITSKLLRFPTEHIQIKNSLEPKLQIYSICSIRILNILEVIGKNDFPKNRSTLIRIATTGKKVKNQCRLDFFSIWSATTDLRFGADQWSDWGENTNWRDAPGQIVRLFLPLKNGQNWQWAERNHCM